jgi:hypothetical protein
MSLGVINHGMSLFVLYLNIHTVPIADTIRCPGCPPFLLFFQFRFYILLNWLSGGRIVVGFTTTCAISSYHN